MRLQSDVGISLDGCNADCHGGFLKGRSLTNYMPVEVFACMLPTGLPYETRTCSFCGGAGLSLHNS